MKQFIGCDAHKRYSVFVAVGEDGRCGPEWKVTHTDGAFEAFLEALPAGSEIALEACSSYYWMVAAMERMSWFSRKWRAGVFRKRVFRPSGGDFQGIGVYRSDEVLGGAQSRARTPRLHRLDEPTRLSLGRVAFQQSPLPFHLAQSL